MIIIEYWYWLFAIITPLSADYCFSAIIYAVLRWAEASWEYASHRAFSLPLRRFFDFLLHCRFFAYVFFHFSKPYFRDAAPSFFLHIFFYFFFFDIFFFYFLSSLAPSSARVSSPSSQFSFFFFAMIRVFSDCQRWFSPMPIAFQPPLAVFRRRCRHADFLPPFDIFQRFFFSPPIFFAAIISATFSSISFHYARCHDISIFHILPFFISRLSASPMPLFADIRRWSLASFSSFHMIARRFIDAAIEGLFSQSWLAELADSRQPLGWLPAIHYASQPLHYSCAASQPFTPLFRSDRITPLLITHDILLIRQTA